MKRENERAAMLPRYPDYDVLAKRDTPSWNDATRRAIDARLKVAATAPRALDAERFATLRALCARIAPQPAGGDAIPTAALIDARLANDEGDGFRDARLPPLRDAWRIGLAALDAMAHRAHRASFASLDGDTADALLRAVQRGEIDAADRAAWAGMDARTFFAKRVLMDICGAYYSHPYAWNEIGFGGPASPRGYVRMDFNRRDPWEARVGGDDDGR
ncbi:gluconate 2-dehydrogenase subunit 3 family protein [Burkholderia multivorans]|uniref:gluconate 2-dehydrogenase subunit 3 family protein n=1 Tax=Burkholderia multivorans TaxID=87883 RepID=UPI001C233721|nr:gluconate 2-dehydrogenase subunit 3 family protein [Burkholderia multivorans]MBU9204045.1 gluconate 2-dehydrogenase subunit 3 family protein [Burkholderia multivorans]MCA8388984.1 gluconate 2-dehydrogenase subunit 3 family protein [Burkholderia multivorans]MCO8352151.1 gluconate 2-dehydrogenase subunit 3 family protein [Burkholderia multivorans]MCO8388811.1 gluconate 2-dehydrogenase subunit 3 family protein [Burkholderia multivorans]MCO8409674.1 gluconate 2-dehydrogenase subunit 3 family pr